MDKFAKAQKIVEEYHKLRLDKIAKETFDINKKLKDLGYTDEEYLKDSYDYYLKSGITIKYVTPSEILSAITFSKGNTLLINNSSEPCVYTGNSEFNVKYCEDNKIEIVSFGYSGGTIVTSPKDVGFLFILDKGSLSEHLRKKFSSWITLSVKKSEVLGNDILIDGMKVVGTAEKTIGDKKLYYFQTSFSVDLDLIKNICSKEMVKTPRGLLDFGDKNRDDLIKEVLSWLQ